MAASRRAYIFSAFLSSVLSVLLIIVAASSDSWIVSSATTDAQARDSSLRYGLFRGELILNTLATPTFSTVYMTCVSDLNACAASCKTNPAARENEVRALASGFATNEACAAVTTVDYNRPLASPAVISFRVYVTLTFFLFLQLVTAVTSAALAILNAMKNPTEPVFGLPGCLWSNVLAGCLGLLVMMLFGIYYATSGLRDHLAFSYIATGLFSASPSLGYSFWILVVPIICSLTNVGLIELRRYLLERDPPAPTIKLENHSDGSIFLY